MPGSGLGREILVRTDTGGQAKAFASNCYDAGIRFYGYELKAWPRGVRGLPKSAWRAAIDAEGKAREGAQVAELTVEVDLSHWPEARG